MAMPSPFQDSDVPRRSTQAKRVVREHLRRHAAGKPLDAEQILSAYPELMPELGQEIRKLQLIDGARLQVESKLGSDGSASARVPSRDSAPGTPPPDSIPGYEIVRKVHRGGQGIVYEALQEGTNRSVAIKVMREGLFSGPHDRARFEREILILGRLDHPNIVTIHESGTAAGHFYYVMDYVDGRLLDVHMAAAERTIEETLRLFAKICLAVNAAHLRGIIHRDLKPSNLRIDEQGEPCVLDFGLAKVASHEETGGFSAAMTVTGQFVGSLPWAAPEQVDGGFGGTDLRTDVYALGVILYQMLTGQFPYFVVGNVRDVMDNIVNAEPTKPSTIRREVDDEVETIVLQCLNKDPDRRYQSAGDLARDTQFYLTGRPIEAKRDSTWYVLRKTLRRHKLPVAVATTFLALVVGSAISISVMYTRANHEARTANRALASLERIFTGFDPRAAPGTPVSPRAILNRSIDNVIETLREEPAAQARVMETAARAFVGLGQHDRAVPWWRKALVLRRDVLGNDDRIVAMTLARLARALFISGHYDEAEARYQEALDKLRGAGGGPDSGAVRFLWEYGGFLQNKGDYKSASELCEQALTMARSLHGRDDRDVVEALMSVAGVLHDMSDYVGAESHYREGLAMALRMSSGDDDRFVVSILELLGLLYKDIGDYAASEPRIRESVAMGQRLFGEESSAVAGAYLALAKLNTDTGQLDVAENACRKALDLHRKVFGPEAKNTARPMTLLGHILVQQERYQEAVPLLQEALEIRRNRKPPGHWKTEKTKSILAAAWTGLGRYAEAEPLLLNSYPVIAADRGPNHRRTIEALNRIITLYEAWGKPERAAEYRAKSPSPSEN